MNALWAKKLGFLEGNRLIQHIAELWGTSYGEIAKYMDCLQVIDCIEHK